MKLENQQSTITNPQFSGGRPIGSGSYTGNSSFASASVDLTGIVTSTGSFYTTSTFGHIAYYNLTASNQTVANLNATSSGTAPSYWYISISGSSTAAQKVAAISSFMNVSSSALRTNSNSTTLYMTSSINGIAGNTVSLTSGSTTTTLAGGVGRSDYPYTFPFIAGGLYVGQIGDLSATTIDGSKLLFFSASGFIPGVFAGVDAYPTTTALGVIALK